MVKLGIIGAENSHSFRIGEVCNVMKKVPMRVTLIWGEKDRFARESAAKGAIPGTVKDWREMLGAVDGVMIDHRHPKYHYEPARFFLEHKVPVFVDKPFTGALREAKALLDLSEKKGVPICSTAALPIRPNFLNFKKQVKKSGEVYVLNSSGPADIKSRYGGIFFYGIHQVDAMIEILGIDIKRVFLHQNPPNAIATLAFRSGAMATINCIQQGGAFHWRICTAKGVVSHQDSHEPIPYLPSARLIYRLLKKGEHPFSRKRMLAPIAVLEALQKSQKTGKPVSLRPL